MKAMLRLAVLLVAFASAPVYAQVLTNCTAAELAAALAQDEAVVRITNCSISLSSPLAISGHVTILGGGTNSTITGGNGTRLFEVLSGGRLEIYGLSLTAGSSEQGGAVYVHPNGQAYFSNTLFSANSAVGLSATNAMNGSTNTTEGGNGDVGANGTTGFGGAIYNLGQTELAYCRLVNNSAEGGDGGQGGDGGDGGWEGGNGGRGGNGAAGRGGAIYNLGSLMICRSSLEGNLARGGAGALGGSGGNGAQPGIAGSGGYGARGFGAAIYNEGLAQISGCTFVTNVATGGSSGHDGTLNGGLSGGDGYNGGGAFGGAIFTSGSMTTTNCTFTSNKVIGGSGANGGNGSYEAGDGGDGGEAYGGAIYNSGVYWLLNSTLSQNAAVGGTNGIAGSGPAAGSDGDRGLTGGAGIHSTAAGEFNIKNSIVASSTGASNGGGVFKDLGQNISSDGTIATGSSSIKNRNPRLAALSDNGGPTRTMMPQLGSPAVNAADPAGAPAVDQRGLPRTNGVPDIGAVEVQGPVITNQPVSLLTSLNRTATFSVGATGDRPLLFRWQRSGTNISRATNSTYVITNVNASHLGNYSVIVTNAAGFVRSVEVTLALGDTPVITTNPVSQTVPAGTNVSFTVSATGSAPLSVQWRSNGVPFASWTNWTLLITNAQVSYSASYAAKVSNSSGSVTSSPAQLIVVSAPTMTPGLLPGGTNLGFTFQTTTGLLYITEFKSNLTSSAWIPLLTNVGNGLVLTNRDTLTNMPSRFYRIRTL